MEWSHVENNRIHILIRYSDVVGDATNKIVGVYSDVEVANDARDLLKDQLIGDYNDVGFGVESYDINGGMAMEERWNLNGITRKSRLDRPRKWGISK